MNQAKLQDIHIQTRRIYNLLGEVHDLSRQLADALDRDDQVSVQMLLAMREEPIRQLTNVREGIGQRLQEGPAEENQRLRALLNGAPAETDHEKRFAEQVQVNARLLMRVRELDEQLSRKIARDRSVYRKK